MNGCHNREPVRNTAMVQAGWRDGYNHSRMPLMVEIPVPMTKSCQYQKLKKDDPKCQGCRELE